MDEFGPQQWLTTHAGENTAPVVIEPINGSARDVFGHSLHLGYDKNGNPQTASVQGTIDDKGNFTATQIGNDANGNLVDRTTRTGTYTADVTGGGVQLSNNGGASSATGVFVNTDVAPTGNQLQSYDTVVQAGNLPGFLFTFTNSKLEANQTAAGFFSFSGTVLEADQALQAAGFRYEPLGLNFGKNEYRSPGTPGTGANSGHFNVQPGVLTFGNMHFGEHNPFASAEAAWEHMEELF